MNCCGFAARKELSTKAGFNKGSGAIHLPPLLAFTQCFTHLAEKHWKMPWGQLPARGQGWDEDTLFPFPRHLPSEPVVSAKARIRTWGPLEQRAEQVTRDQAPQRYHEVAGRYQLQVGSQGPTLKERHKQWQSSCAKIQARRKQARKQGTRSPASRGGGWPVRPT